MPRQKTRHRRGFYEFPEDFAGVPGDGSRRPAGCPGASWPAAWEPVPLTIRRWLAGVQPTSHYLLALQDLAEELGLAHLLPRARALHRSRPRG